MFRMCACVLLLTTFILHTKSDNESESSHCDKWGITFDQGQKVTVPKQCTEATCVDASRNEISLLSCKKFKLRSECHLTNENLELPYPDCCPQPVCPPLV